MIYTKLKFKKFYFFFLCFQNDFGRVKFEKKISYYHPLGVEIDLLNEPDIRNDEIPSVFRI